MNSLTLDDPAGRKASEEAGRLIRFRTRTHSQRGCEQVNCQQRRTRRPRQFRGPIHTPLPAGMILELENDAGGNLRTILVSAEIARSHRVRFEAVCPAPAARGDVNSTAQLVGKRALV